MAVEFTIGCGASPIPDASPDLYHRRAWVGSTARGAWMAALLGAQLCVVPVQHNGTRVNPIAYEGALAGGVVQYAALASGHQSPTQVAEAVRLAWVAHGAAATRIGNVVRVPEATDPLVGAAPALGAEGLRGRWGTQRYLLNGGENTGPVTGAVMHRIVMPAFAGRVVAVGTIGSGGFRPRLAVARGGTWATPGTFTDLLEARVPVALNDYTPGVAVLPEPLSFTAGEALWAISRDTGVGTQAYRVHGATPAVRGNLTVDENLRHDQAIDGDPDLPFGTSYAPTLSTSYGIYGGMFLVIECAPYRADGRIQPSWLGANRAATGNGPSSVVLANEWASHRLRAAQFERVRATRARVSIGNRSAAEGLGVSMYQYPDDAIPPTSGGPLLGEFVRMDPAAANAYAEVAAAAPIELGVEQLGADAIVALGYNCGLIGGGVPTVTQFVFDPATADRLHLSAWPDGADAAIHNDWITSINARMEHRTRSSVGGLMPENDPDAVMPATLLVDDSDDNPDNAARSAFLLESSDPGYSAAEVPDVTPGAGGGLPLAFLAPEVLDV